MLASVSAMDATTSAPLQPGPRWRFPPAGLLRGDRAMRVVEIATVVALAGMVGASYFVLTRESSSVALLTPPLVALLLVANLVPAMALMVLIARRLARARAERSEIGGKGRLHTRLVALFSMIAAVPTVLVVIFASLLFQSGVQFWFSDNARTVLRNAASVARVYRDENMTRIRRDAEAMGTDVVQAINAVGFEGQAIQDELLIQKAFRNLDEAAIISVSSRGEPQTRAMIDLDSRPVEQRVSADALVKLRAGETLVATDAGDRVEAVIRLDPDAEVYLYVSRKANASVLASIVQSSKAASDYQDTLDRSRALQFRFNVVLLLVSLLIVGLSIWIALTLADRLVRPVGALVGAARKVTAGDLTARVPIDGARDEVGTLGDAFNRMTQRLEEQTGALVSANSQLDTRRAFTEAVLSGVTAGVLSIDEDQRIRLINRSAEALLKAGDASPIGRKLGDLAPELGEFVAGDAREATVEVAQDSRPRTLAVKRVRVKGGYVLTFDDITDQLLDQRQAAWSDVARRIAHEIKNPLTPIQLAAERLQRRYGSQIANEPEIFERLTGTIVRQVGDLRRMVDEFSGFARMPKPVFREEQVADIVRETLFLHEVAHPGIRFIFDVGHPEPTLVCDRRQIGQALTNLVKNAVEAIEAQRNKGEAREGGEAVRVSLAADGGFVVLDVSDTGVGLPADRARLTEPYMTTRARGTGLGLAIVKKIVEEHFGDMAFSDRPGGGSHVRIRFDAEKSARMAAPDDAERRVLQSEEDR